MNDLPELPTEIILDLPTRVAIALEAVAQTSDRSIEYVALQWLSREAEARYAISAAYLERAEQEKPRLEMKIGKERRLMTKTMRLQVFKRDGFKCVYCGAGRDAELHVDHKIPVIKGGKTLLDNLQTLCAACNLGKATKPDLLSNVVELQARK